MEVGGRSAAKKRGKNLLIDYRKEVSKLFLNVLVCFSFHLKKIKKYLFVTSGSASYFLGVIPLVLILTN